jgi:integrase
MHVLTAEEAERFRQAATGTRFAPLFELALATGMRPGEYLALQWKHVDLKAGTVRVERALVEAEGKLSIAPPKTSRSRRTIPLPPSVTRALAAHKERQAGDQPTTIDGSGLVFPSETGGHMNERNLLRRYFRPTLAATGLDPRKYRLYDLRHTCATLLLLAGENPKVVSERLGHASVTLTLDVYSHVLPTMQEAAADKLERLLYGSGA